MDGSLAMGDGGTGGDGNAADQTAGDALSSTDAVTADAAGSSDALGDGGSNLDGSGGEGGGCDPGFVLDAGLSDACPQGNCNAIHVGDSNTGQAVVATFLALSTDYLYWSGEMSRAPLDGGPAQYLGAEGVGVALDSSNVYFASGGAYSIPLDGLDGGVPTYLGDLSYQRIASTATYQGIALAANATSLYMTGAYGGGAASWPNTACCVSLTSMPLTGVPDGGAGSAVGGGEAHCYTRVLLDDTRVYWSVHNAVVAAPLNGGSTVTVGQAIASNACPDPNGFGGQGGYMGYGLLSLGATPLAMDSTYVYTADGLNVVRINKTTGQSTTLATADAGGVISAVAVDGQRVYWAENHAPGASLGSNGIGYIKSASLDGTCPGGVLASVSLPNFFLYGGFGYWDLLVDAHNLYWSVEVQRESWQIWRLPR
jgi:hypothetical protein